MSARAVVRFKRLEHARGLPLPSYQTAGSAGMDLQAAVPEHEPVILAPGERALVPTGFAHGDPARLRGAGAAAIGQCAETGHDMPQCPRDDRL